MSTRKCGYCKKNKPLSCFVIKICEECRPKKNAVNKKYHAGATGQKTSAKYWKSDDGKNVVKKYKDSGKWKETWTTWREDHVQRPEWLEKHGDRAESNAKWRQSQKGLDYQIKRNSENSSRYHTDAAYRLERALQVKMARLIHGTRIQSDTVCEFTEFVDRDDVRLISSCR